MLLEDLFLGIGFRRAEDELLLDRVAEEEEQGINDRLDQCRCLEMEKEGDEAYDACAYAHLDYREKCIFSERCAFGSAALEYEFVVDEIVIDRGDNSRADRCHEDAHADISDRY